ncbi:uncharacterized protein BO72DRAFT_446383 [Aspergillus fijiensis CBS 313.89]|uniref:Uncharacterized protein n=1 Tax=Aspergillus fijiensis CBS 313.89 TaxID=1448319 RepID=A0A8G1RX16_9EURO|nr:uncharacterized protein BO72DRAFT_446383 [Aspergillus fijiensis CBS 313.89]RAK79091.1 hypothetical protein BO72DRAFT_446383 [Aspergillus fijiensis CBS 313.89]
MSKKQALVQEETPADLVLDHQHLAGTGSQYCSYILPGVAGEIEGRPPSSVLQFLFDSRGRLARLGHTC